MDAGINELREGDHKNLVIFRLDKETYALPVNAIVQIMPMLTITPIPQVHKAVEGIINVRGAAIPVIKMRRYLGLSEVPLSLHTPIILIQTDGWRMGLIVDEVIDVLALPSEQIRTITDIMPKSLGDVPILQGFVHMSDGTILVLDINQLFLPGQVRALSQAIAALSSGPQGAERAAAKPSVGDGDGDGRPVPELEEQALPLEASDKTLVRETV